MKAKDKALKLAPLAPASADLQAIYARLCDVLAELFAHPDCPASIAHVLNEAQIALLNEAQSHTYDVTARYLLPLALAELSKKEGEQDGDTED